MNICFWSKICKILMKNDIIMYFRKSKSLFDDLFSMLKIELTFPIDHRYSVFAGERLAVTLCYLAFDDSQQTIAIEFRLKKSAVNQIIQKTFKFIWEKLSPKFVKFPSLEKWKDNANDFGKLWNYSHCLGAIDGKHIAIKTPQTVAVTTLITRVLVQLF